MKEIGLALLVLGCLVLAFPLYDHFVHFITLSVGHARIIGAGLIVFGGLSLALAPR